MPIVLASGSPRRSQILKDAGFDFTVLSLDVDERFPAGMPAVNVPLMLAQRKMQAAQQHVFPEDIIITADTVVVLEDTIIGKPEDRNDAFGILRSLSGKKHTVITGICIAKGHTHVDIEVSTAVYFESLSDEEIGFYLDTFQPYDKAGAYAIQEWIGMNKISRIEGDYYNVVGFPMSKIFPVLNTFLSLKSGE